jgi:hypothetical protein
MNEYKSFYLKELLQLIDQVTLEAISNPAPEGALPDCRLRCRLGGIFDVVDELKASLIGGDEDGKSNV